MHSLACSLVYLLYYALTCSTAPRAAAGQYAYLLVHAFYYALTCSTAPLQTMLRITSMRGAQSAGLATFSHGALQSLDPLLHLPPLHPL